MLWTDDQIQGCASPPTRTLTSQMVFLDNQTFVSHVGTGIVAVSCPGGTGAGVYMFPLLERLYVITHLCFPTDGIDWLTLGCAHRCLWFIGT